MKINQNEYQTLKTTYIHPKYLIKTYETSIKNIINTYTRRSIQVKIYSKFRGPKTKF